MAGGTEETVKAEVISVIEAIAVSDLGFDSGYTNVNDYLLSEEWKDGIGSYLMRGRVGGEEYVRAIGVQVTAGENSESFHRLGVMREYAILIELYYGFYGISPQAVLRSAARKIRQAIFSGSGKNLNGKVDRVSAISTLEVQRTSVPSDVPFEVMVGRMIARAEEQNPGW